MAPSPGQYERELRERIIPFWENHSIDTEFGGYFSCLDRDGSVYDTEKFMWMQWRIVWMFSHLYCELERNPRWIEIARGGYEFLIRHGVDPLGRYYFSLARDGTPATAPYNVYSDCFAAMGAAALYRATGDDAARAEALRAFAVYRSRREHPKAQWDKALVGKPKLQKLGYFMMEINLALVMEDCLGTQEFRESAAAGIDHILDTFWNEELKLLMEYATPDGRFRLDVPLGRHLCPGHAAEGMWLIMLAAERLGRRDAIDRAATILLRMLEFGWDAQHGGLLYFMDALGRPHTELHWDMKPWWPHCEALIATALAHRLTGRHEFMEWFDRLHDYTWSHFPDPQYGEWFGYLNRRGEPTHLLKGGKWKSFFHLPRMLLMCAKLLNKTPDRPQ